MNGKAEGKAEEMEMRGEKRHSSLFIRSHPSFWYVAGHGTSLSFKERPFGTVDLSYNYLFIFLKEM